MEAKSEIKSMYKGREISRDLFDALEKSSLNERRIEKLEDNMEVVRRGVVALTNAMRTLNNDLEAP